ncbi:EF-hand domain-containing protein [Glaciimonas soli]|nr:EF-hand domain-containing protein [Glaciimonas soli]
MRYTSSFLFSLVIAACSQNPITTAPPIAVTQAPSADTLPASPLATAPTAPVIVPSQQEVKAERRFDRWDINGDGKITREEFRIAMIKRFYKRDKNKSGKLSPDEVVALRLPAGELPKGGITVAQFQAAVDRAFDQLDLNHDGFITRDEYDRVRRSQKNTMPLPAATQTQPSGSQP